MTEAIDMSQFIEARSDQLNSDDLIGRSITATVTKVAGSEGEQPVAIYFEGDNGKPFKPCKTIRRVLVAVWGRYANDYVGRSMTLYRDDAVTFGGLQVGGIRISHMSHLEKETIVVVAKSKGKKAGMKILPLVTDSTPKDDPAAKWAGQYIAKIATLTTPTDLGAFVDSKASKLAELADKRPDLHGQVTGARDARAAALSSDPFDDTPHPASATADRILTQLEKVETVIDLDKLRLDCANDMEAMPDEMSATLNGAFDAARARLNPSATGGNQSSTQGDK